MKRSLLPLSFLLITLTSSTALADHIYLAVNSGFGDNFGFSGQFNGHPLFLSGGVAVDFFGFEPYAPGSTFGGDTTLYLYDSVAWIDGTPMDFFFPADNSTLFMSSFTLPTDGRAFFSVPVQISFGATGINPDTGQTIEVGGYARGWISFS